MERCHWCTDDPLYMAYHDTEWGVPSRDPQHLFEKLVLEGFQAGLSWFTVLKKREHMRHVLFEFNPHALAQLSDDQINALLLDPGIIRNRLKLQAARRNARAWLALDTPADQIWSFVDHEPIVHHYAHARSVPSTSPQAEALSKHLKQSGFSFVGPTICHAYLQAIGAFMDHTTNCHRHSALATA